MFKTDLIKGVCFIIVLGVLAVCSSAQAQESCSSDVVSIGSEVIHLEDEAEYRIHINVKPGWYLFGEVPAESGYQTLQLDIQHAGNNHVLSGLCLESCSSIVSKGSFVYYSGSLVFTQQFKRMDFGEADMTSGTIIFQACCENHSLPVAYQSIALGR